MPTPDLEEGITDQFSYTSARADVWRLFDLLLDTDAYLNLGYSAWYQTPLDGRSQHRLVDQLEARLETSLPTTPETRVLDVGCGRGGPSIRLADDLDVSVVGVDLVPYNVASATEKTPPKRGTVGFLVGDATRLPLRAATVSAAVSIDAFVYLPDTAAVFDELARVLADDGVLVFSTLCLRDDPTSVERDAAARFARAWDMPTPKPFTTLERELADAGFTLTEVTDVTANSVGRFRKWTTLYLRLAETPLRRPYDWTLAHYGLHPDTVHEQIERAHDALPALRHVIAVANRSK